MFARSCPFVLTPAALMVALALASPVSAQRGESAIQGAATGFPVTISIDETRSANELTAAERQSGWRLLWDGRSTAGWRGAGSDEFPESGWTVADGELAVRAARLFEFRAGGDLLTIEAFGDFIFDFEFRIAAGANSGVKYWAKEQRRLGFVHSLGCEYQILDDLMHADAERGRDGNRRLASLYDLLPARMPAPNETLFRGVDQWNHGRIHVEERRIGHYLNGALVLEVARDSARFREALADSKFAGRADFCPGPSGRIVLQDHGDDVRFRNLRIKPLD